MKASWALRSLQVETASRPPRSRKPTPIHDLFLTAEAAINNSRTATAAEPTTLLHGSILTMQLTRRRQVLDKSKQNHVRYQLMY